MKRMILGLVFALVVVALGFGLIGSAKASAYLSCLPGWEVDPSDPGICRKLVTVPPAVGSVVTTHEWVDDPRGLPYTDTRTISTPSMGHTEYLVTIVDQPATDQVVSYTLDISFMYKRDGNSGNCSLLNQYKHDPDYRQAPTFFSNTVQDAYYGGSCHVIGNWTEIVHSDAITHQVWVRFEDLHGRPYTQTQEIIDIQGTSHTEYYIEVTTYGIPRCSDGFELDDSEKFCTGYIYMPRGEAEPTSTDVPADPTATPEPTAVSAPPEPGMVKYLSNVALYVSPTGQFGDVVDDQGNVVNKYFYCITRPSADMRYQFQHACESGVDNSLSAMRDIDRPIPNDWVLVCVGDVYGPSVKPDLKPGESVQGVWDCDPQLAAISINYGRIIQGYRFPLWSTNHQNLIDGFSSH